MNPVLETLVIITIAITIVYTFGATLAWLGEGEVLGPVGSFWRWLSLRGADHRLPSEMREMTPDQMAALYTADQLDKIWKTSDSRRVKMACNLRKAQDIIAEENET